MKAEELNGTHIGKRMTVNDRNIASAGTLVGVQHEADMLEEKALGHARRDHFVAGQRAVLLVFLPDSIIRVEPGAAIELLEE